MRIFATIWLSSLFLFCVVGLGYLCFIEPNFWKLMLQLIGICTIGCITLACGLYLTETK